MPTVNLPYHFSPRSYQWEVFEAWDRGVRRFLEIWHRRAGKDKTLLNFMVERMLERKGNYVHLFPLKTQARRVIWQGIDRNGQRYIDHFPPELVWHTPNEQEMRITLIDPLNPSQPGSTYNLLGADKDTNVLVGSNPMGIILSEYPLMNPRAWELTRPILTENKGWAAFVYTTRGKNHGFSLYRQVKDNPTWHVSLLTVEMTRRDGVGEDGTPVITQEDIEADRAEGMSEADIQQEYYCAWETPIPGAIYGDAIRDAYAENRIGSVGMIPGYAVRTCWDLGYWDTTAIWFFQMIPGADGLPWYHFLDYREDSLKALGHYVKLVRELNYPYDDGGREWHYAPHDARQHELGYGKTVETIAMEPVELTDGRKVPGLAMHVVERGSVHVGIEATRVMLRRCRFDVDRCELGLSALASYIYEWDERLKQWTKDPLHNWASHGADALRTGVMGVVAARGRQTPLAPGGSFAWAREQARRARQGRGVGSFKVGI